MKSKLIAIALTAGSLVAGAAPMQTITINTSKKGAAIPETMYGLFFEDINFGADGGLYAEKIKNRSFEYGPDAANENMHGFIVSYTVIYCK